MKKRSIRQRSIVRSFTRERKYDDRPVCKIHKCRMRCDHSGDLKRYYYCVRPGCDESQVMVRPRMRAA